MSFQKLAAKGGVLVSAEFSTDRVQVEIENRSNQSCVRNFRVRLPEGTTRIRESEDGLKIENGWAVLSDVNLPPKGIRTYFFTVTKRTQSAK